MLPPSLEDWISPDHPARFVRDLVESLDLHALGFEVRASTPDAGRPSYATDVLLKVWLFGWMERVRTSRQLEKACRRDVAFLWLTGNLHPDHNTLWRFFDAHKAVLPALFKKIVQVAAYAGLVGFALHALDGTKMVATCSDETALHRTRLMERLEKLDAIIAQQVAEAKKAEEAADASYAMPERLHDAQERKKVITQALAELDEAKTEHLHPGEPDARLMKGRHEYTMGYNAQAVVDHESDLIVGSDVVTEQNDQSQVVPMLEQVSETLGRPADQSVVDSGYASGAQIVEAEKRRLPLLANLPEEPANTASKGDYSKANFRYDAERDVYICPQGQVLRRKSESRSREGSTSVGIVYACYQRDCPVLAQCTSNKNGRTVKRSVHEDALERQREKQHDHAMQILLSLRGEIVEHIFGLIKGNDGFRRFTVRGLLGAKAQWALACVAVNLRKLHVFWCQKRLVLNG